MKKIINGRKYDTATATLVCSYEEGQYNDFRYFKEDLYQKKNEEFFLYAEGGPASKYAVKMGQTSCSGEKIIPLTFKEAQEIVENRCDADTYEEIFGEVEE